MLVGALEEAPLGLGDADRHVGPFVVCDAGVLDEGRRELREDLQGRKSAEDESADGRVDVLKGLRSYDGHELGNDGVRDDANEVAHGIGRDGLVSVQSRPALQAHNRYGVVDMLSKIRLARSAVTSPQIASAELEQGVDGLAVNVDIFGAADELDATAGHGAVERLEAELRASAGERLDDPRDVIADDGKARRLGVRLHRSPKGRLCVRRHRIGLVQDDNLVRRARMPTAWAFCVIQNHFHAIHRVRDYLMVIDGHLRKVLDLFTNDPNPTVVRGIELEHAALHELGPKKFARQRKHSRRLARSGRPVKEQVGHLGTVRRERSEETGGQGANVHFWTRASA